MSERESSVQIPDDWAWRILSVIGAANMIVVGWLVRLERRLNDRLTHREHQEICDRANGELKEKLEEIKDVIERQNEQAQLHRTLVGDSLATIRTQVAVIRDRMGDDALSDMTGRHKR